MAARPARRRTQRLAPDVLSRGTTARHPNGRGPPRLPAVLTGAPCAGRSPAAHTACHSRRPCAWRPRWCAEVRLPTGSVRPSMEPEQGKRRGHRAALQRVGETPSGWRCGFAAFEQVGRRHVFARGAERRPAWFECAVHGAGHPAPSGDGSSGNRSQGHRRGRRTRVPGGGARTTPPRNQALRVTAPASPSSIGRRVPCRRTLQR